MNDNNIYKFWVHDPCTSDHKGHPRVLIAFQHSNDGTISYAATTWSPKETLKYPFDRQHATMRVMGRLACPRRSHTIKVSAHGPRMSILADILERDVRNGRTDTARYLACQEAFTRNPGDHRLWQAEAKVEAMLQV